MTTAFLARDRNGDPVTVLSSAIRAVAPDDETVDTTLLFLDEGVVTVAQPYEELIDQLDVALH